VLPGGLLPLFAWRRVVGGERGDGAARRARPQRVAIAVAGGTQRGPDLGQGPPRLHLLLREEEVLGAGFRPHALALGLRLLDAPEPARAGEMHHVDGTARHRADADG